MAPSFEKQGLILVWESGLVQLAGGGSVDHAPAAV